MGHVEKAILGVLEERRRNGGGCTPIRMRALTEATGERHASIRQAAKTLAAKGHVIIGHDDGGHQNPTRLTVALRSVSLSMDRRRAS